jgi:hypothetical protein
MKLGLSYNIWDGEELLPYSIKCIRDSVDYISVVYQTISNFGEKASDNLLEFLNELKNIGLIDELYLYNGYINTEPTATNQDQEVEKRNIGLILSKNNGCTHHMSVDVDEFYIKSQFDYMKNVMTKYDAGFCRHIQYYKDSIYRKEPMEQEYVSTIVKINDNTKYIFEQQCPVAVDPTRKTNNTNYKIFDRSEIEMHHMSFIRNDLRKKLENSACRPGLVATNKQVIEYYDKWTYPNPIMWAGGVLNKVVLVPRIFNISGTYKNE